MEVGAGLIQVDLKSGRVGALQSIWLFFLLSLWKQGHLITRGSSEDVAWQTIRRFSTRRSQISLNARTYDKVMIG